MIPDDYRHLGSNSPDPKATQSAPHSSLKKRKAELSPSLQISQRPSSHPATSINQPDLKKRKMSRDFVSKKSISHPLLEKKERSPAKELKVQPLIKAQINSNLSLLQNKRHLLDELPRLERQTAIREYQALGEAIFHQCISDADLGRYQRALKTLDQLIAIEPNPSYIEKKMDLELEAVNFPAALATLKKWGATANPHYQKEWIFTLSLASFGNGDYLLCEQLLSELTDKFPSESYREKVISLKNEVAYKKEVEARLKQPSLTDAPERGGLTAQEWEILLLSSQNQPLSLEQGEMLEIFLLQLWDNQEKSKQLKDLSSNEQFLESKVADPDIENFQALLSDLAANAYRSQPAKMKMMLRAQEKVSHILTTLENAEKFKTASSIISLLTAIEKEGPSSPLKNHYLPQQIQETLAHYQKVKAQLEEEGIEVISRLTPKELMSLNSLDNLYTYTETCSTWCTISDTSQMASFKEIAKKAKANNKKLLKLLGASYETGDLTWRNFQKFENVTGKPLGTLMEIYKKGISPFGHGAFIDKIRGEKLMYSHVLGQFTHNRVDLQEFFTQDVYRLQTDPLLTSQGKKGLLSLLEKIQQAGDEDHVNPLLTLEQYVQQLFTSHIETILAGEDSLQDIEGLQKEISSDQIDLADSYQFVYDELLQSFEFDSSSLDYNPSAKWILNQPKIIVAQMRTLMEEEDLSAEVIDIFSDLLEENDPSTLTERLLNHLIKDLPPESKQRIGQALFCPLEKFEQRLKAAQNKLSTKKGRAEFNRLKGLGEENAQKRLQKLKTHTKQQLQHYHEKTFGSIANDGHLQYRSMRSPIHMRLDRLNPWSSQGPLNFATVQFEGKMICTQFQALVAMKALAQTRLELQEKIAHHLVATEGIEEKQALAFADKQCLNTLPISPWEDFSKMHPKRLVDCFRQFLKPVAMSPLAQEIIDAPQAFFKPALSE